MFMSAALNNVSRDRDSDFGLMHLNALNGSTSAIEDSKEHSYFGPSFNNDEPMSCTFAKDSLTQASPGRLFTKENLKSSSSGKLKPHIPNPIFSRSKVKSPYLLRRMAKTGKYEVDICSTSDETAHSNVLKNNIAKNTLEAEDCEVKCEAIKPRKNYTDIRVAKSLNFDSLAQKTTTCKENKK